MSDFSLCDEIKLISLVAENPCLYDSSIREFSSGGVRTKAWTKIAAQLNKKLDACRKVWRIISFAYKKAVRNSKLGIGDPESWKSKHHDLLASFYSVKTKEEPIVESIYSLETPMDVKLESSPNSSKIEWVDCDLNVVEPPKTVVDNQQQNDGEYVGQSLSRSSLEGQELSSQTADDVETRSSGGQGRSLPSKTADGEGQDVTETVVGRGYVEQHSSRSSAQGQREKRSSRRVKHKVELNGSVDEDIVAEILREERELLQQYRRQKTSDGSAMQKRGGRSLDVSAKKRRINTAKKLQIDTKNTKKSVHGEDDIENDVDVENVDEVDGNSRESEGGEAQITRSGNSRGGDRNSRFSKDGGGQSRNLGRKRQRGRNLRRRATQGSQQHSDKSGQNSSGNRSNLRLDDQNSSGSGNNLRLGSFDDQNLGRGGNNLRLGSPSDEQNCDVTPHRVQHKQLLYTDFDDVDLFCRHICSVLRSLPPLQKAVAKKDLNTVLSHYEIVAAKNAAGQSSAASNNHRSPAGMETNATGWNLVTSTRMEGMSMLATPTLSFMGGQI